MDNKEQIAKAAEELFMAYGIRSVSMDDISRKIFISKKTIYQHYRDKEEIVCLVTERVLQKERDKLISIKEVARDAIHEIVLVSQYLREYLYNVNPSVLFDLQKYHLQAWKIYLRFKDSVFLEALKETLHRGIEEGFFRKELDADVLARLRVGEVQMASDSEIFPHDQFNFREVQLQLFDHFMHGVLTSKGRKKLAQYSEKFLNNEI